MTKSLAKRIFNRVLAQFARILPGATSLRPALHRLRGVKITGKVFIGDDVYMENDYPEAIELHDGAQVCLRSVLIAHTRGVGRIIIGKNAFIGANTVITAPVDRVLTIGEGSVVAVSSVVASDVPPGTLYGAQKGKVMARVTVPLTMETPYDAFLTGLRPLSKRK